MDDIKTYTKKKKFFFPQKFNKILHQKKSDFSRKNIKLLTNKMRILMVIYSGISKIATMATNDAVW